MFVEKPIADTVAAGERIRDACVAAGVLLMVGHAFRRLGAARRAAEVVRSGRLGEVVLAEATFSLPGKLGPQAWRAHRERNPGGPLMQLGIHHVDTLAAWLGPVRETTGRFAHVHTDADIDDVGVATMRFASGALGVLTGSYVSPHTFAVRLQGSAGVLDYRADSAPCGRPPSASTRSRRSRSTASRSASSGATCSPRSSRELDLAIRGDVVDRDRRATRASPRCG